MLTDLLTTALDDDRHGWDPEEQARARERDPRREEGLQALRAMMADRLASPPEFTDLAVVEEWTG